MVEHGKIAARPRLHAPQPAAAPSPARRFGPWGGAVLGNFIFFLAFGLLARSAVKVGVPEPGESIPVEIVSADALVPQEEEERVSEAGRQSETLPEPSPQDVPPDRPAPEPEIAEQPVPDPESLPEVPPAPSLAPSPSAARGQNESAGEVVLPDTDDGGPAGVIALRCYELFSDRDKAEECAGRPQIRSGWTGEGEDWSHIADALRRGGVNTPSDPYIGPPTGGLADGAEYYEPFDDGLVIGRDLADRLLDERRFNELKDSRRTISEMQSTVDNVFSNIEGGTVPLFLERWEPSWVLREDPYVDDRLIRDMMEEQARRRRDRESNGD